MGWSDGAKTALLMAIKYQSRVEKMIIWGGNAYSLPVEKKVLNACRNVKKMWNEVSRAGYEKVYGDELQSLWDKHVDHYVKNLDDICKDQVKYIKCPTFIMHGDRDLLPLEHPFFLANNIPDARLHRFKDFGHNLHIENASKFNQMAEDFLLEHE